MADTDNMTLTIARQSIVDAGAGKNLCEGQPYLINDASAMNYFSLTWTSSGTGTFRDPHAIHPVYDPSEGDILNGLVLLTLTATSMPPCTPVSSDTLILTILKAPFVYTVPGGSICRDFPFHVTGAGAQNYSSLFWSHNGSGTLTGAN